MSNCTDNNLVENADIIQEMMDKQSDLWAVSFPEGRTEIEIFIGLIHRSQGWQGVYEIQIALVDLGFSKESEVLNTSQIWVRQGIWEHPCPERKDR